MCDGCGKCLAECPVLSLPEKEAQDDFELLRRGDYTASKAFRFCTTCNVCDLTCPQNADPYELILERYETEKQRRGLPSFAKLVFPCEPENIWSGLRVLMDDDERNLVEFWESNLDKKHSEILLTGFYTNIAPFLLQSDVLEELRPITAGSPMLWGCGGDSNKLGAIALTDSVAGLLEKKFAAMGVKKIICSMEAEAAMLAEILPERFGARFDFEITSLDEWLYDKMQSGSLKLDKQLGLKVTVHDNCMSRYLGGRSQDIVRKIVQDTGCELVEMEHCRNRALCCGWAATIPKLHGPGSGNPLNTVMYMMCSIERRMAEAADTGADTIVASCPACYVFMNLFKEVTGAHIKVRHPLELIDMARGNTPPDMAAVRSWQILAVAARLTSRWAASREFRKRYYPKPVDPNNFTKLPAPAPEDAAGIKKYDKYFNGKLVNNSITRSSIRASVKAAMALYRKSLPIDFSR